MTNAARVRARKLYLLPYLTAAASTPTANTTILPNRSAEFELITDTLGRIWNSLLHPRDRYGRFIRTFSRVSYRPKGRSKRAPTFHGDVLGFDRNTGDVRIKITSVDPNYTEHGLKPGQIVQVPQLSLETRLVKANLREGATMKWEHEKTTRAAIARLREIEGGKYAQYADRLDNALALALSDKKRTNKQAVAEFRAVTEFLANEKARIAGVDPDPRKDTPLQDIKDLDSKTRGRIRALDNAINTLTTARHSLGDKVLDFTDDRGRVLKNNPDKRLNKAKAELQLESDEGNNYFDFRTNQWKQAETVTPTAARDDVYQREGENVLPELLPAIAQKTRQALTRSAGFRRTAMVAPGDRYHHDKNGDEVFPGSVVDVDAGSGRGGGRVRPAATMLVTRVHTKTAKEGGTKILTVRHFDPTAYGAKGYHDYRATSKSMELSEIDSQAQGLRNLALVQQEDKAITSLMNAFSKEFVESMMSHYATKDAKGRSRSGGFFDNVPIMHRTRADKNGEKVRWGDWVSLPNGEVGVVSWISGTDPMMRVQTPDGLAIHEISPNNVIKLHSTDAPDKEYVPTRAEAAAAARQIGAEQVATTIEDPNSDHAAIKQAMYADQAFINALPDVQAAFKERDSVLERGEEPSDELKGRIAPFNALAPASAGQFREPKAEITPTPPTTDGVTDPPGRSINQSETIDADANRTATDGVTIPGTTAGPEPEVETGTIPHPKEFNGYGISALFYNDLYKAVHAMPDSPTAEAARRHLIEFSKAMKARDMDAFRKALDNMMSTKTGLYSPELSPGMSRSDLQKFLTKQLAPKSDPNAEAVDWHDYFEDLQQHRPDLFFKPRPETPTTDRPDNVTTDIDIPIGIDVSNDEISKALLEGRPVFFDRRNQQITEGYAVPQKDSAVSFPSAPTAQDLKGFMEDAAPQDDDHIAIWQDPADPSGAAAYHVGMYNVFPADEDGRAKANALAESTEANQFIDISSGEVFNVSGADITQGDEPSPTDKSSDRAIEPTETPGTVAVKRRTAKQKQVLDDLLQTNPDEAAAAAIQAVLDGSPVSADQARAINEHIANLPEEAFLGDTAQARSGARGVAVQLADRIAAATGAVPARGYSSRNTALRRSSDITTGMWRAMAPETDEDIANLLDGARQDIKDGDLGVASAKFREAADLLSTNFPDQPQTARAAQRAREHADRLDASTAAAGRDKPSPTAKTDEVKPPTPTPTPPVEQVADRAKYEGKSFNELNAEMLKRGFSHVEIDAIGKTAKSLDDWVNFLTDALVANDKGTLKPSEAKVEDATPVPAGPNPIEKAKTWADRAKIADWENTKPWEAESDDIAAGRFPGLKLAEKSTGASAMWRDGEDVWLDKSYFNQPPENRRAMLYHEAGHGIASALMKDQNNKALLDGFKRKGTTNKYQSPFNGGDSPDLFDDHDNLPEEFISDMYSTLARGDAWIYVENPPTGVTPEAISAMYDKIADYARDIGYPIHPDAMVNPEQHEVTPTPEIPVPVTANEPPANGGLAGLAELYRRFEGRDVPLKEHVNGTQAAQGINDWIKTGRASADFNKWFRDESTPEQVRDLFDRIINDPEYRGTVGSTWDLLNKWAADGSLLPERGAPPTPTAPEGREIVNGTDITDWPEEAKDLKRTFPDAGPNLQGPYRQADRFLEGEITVTPAQARALDSLLVGLDSSESRQDIAKRSGGTAAKPTYSTWDLENLIATIDEKVEDAGVEPSATAEEKRDAKNLAAVNIKLKALRDQQLGTPETPEEAPEAVPEPAVERPRVVMMEYKSKASAQRGLKRVAPILPHLNPTVEQLPDGKWGVVMDSTGESTPTPSPTTPEITPDVIDAEEVADQATFDADISEPRPSDVLDEDPSMTPEANQAEAAAREDYEQNAIEETTGNPVVTPERDPLANPIDNMDDDAVDGMLGIGEVDEEGFDPFAGDAETIDQDYLDDVQGGLLGAPATSHEADAAMDSVAKDPPTDEQRAVTRAALTFKSIVVRALAGTGKTSTLEVIARASQKIDPAHRFLYIAFNKSIQTEAEKRMPGNTEARTADSLAWVSVGRRLTDKKERNARSGGRSDGKGLFTWDLVASHFNVKDMPKEGKDKRAIVQAAERTVAKFLISADDNISATHLTDADEGTALGNEVLRVANAMWKDHQDPDGRMPFTNSVATKIWALSRPDLRTAGKSKANAIFWDEAQDINDVLAKILNDNKNNVQLIIVGDQNQAIYGFRGAKDLLQQMQLEYDLPLTKSWRFGPQVAAMGNMFLDLLDPKRTQHRVVGGGGTGTIVDPDTMIDADAVLARSNGGAIGEILSEIDRGRAVGTSKRFRQNLRDLADTIDFLRQNTGGTPSKKLHEDFESYTTWQEVEEDVEQGNANQKVLMFHKILKQHSTQSLRDLAGKLIIIDDEFSGELPTVKNVNTDGGRRVIGGGLATSFKDNPPYAMYYWTDSAGNLRIHGVPKELQDSSGDDFGDFKKFLQRQTGKPPRWVNAASAKSVGIDKPSSHLTIAGLNDQQKVDLLNAIAKEYGTPKPDVVVVTAHLSKGLEWDRVRIAGDFRGPEADPTDPDKPPIMPNEEEMRLAYVAVTRAKKVLDPGSLAWVWDFAAQDNLDTIGRGDHEVVSRPGDIQNPVTTEEVTPTPTTTTPEPEPFKSPSIGKEARAAGGAPGKMPAVTSMDALPIQGALPRHVKRQMDKMSPNAKTFLGAFLKGKGANIIFSQNGLEGALGELVPEGIETTPADPRALKDVNGAYLRETGHIIISDLETGNDDSDFLHEVGHAIDYGLGEYHYGTGGKPLSSHSSFAGAYKQLIAGSRINADGRSSLDPYLMQNRDAAEGEAHNGANGIREAFAQMFQMRQVAANLLGKSAKPNEINAFAARRFVSEHLDEVKGYDEAQVQGAALSMARYLGSVDDLLDRVTGAPDGGILEAADAAPITRSSILRAAPVNDLGELDPGVDPTGSNHPTGGPSAPKNGTNFRKLSTATRTALRKQLRDFAEEIGARAKTIPEMRDNVIASVAVASARERAYGMRWYSDARQAAQDLAASHGHEWHFSSAIIAATSPKTRWEANRAAADLVQRSLNPAPIPEDPAKRMMVSPTIDDAFLNTKVRVRNADMSVREMLASDPALRDALTKEAGLWKKNMKESEKLSWDKVEEFVDKQLAAKLDDGSAPRLYQYAHDEFRTGLINANNRVIGRQQQLDMGVPEDQLDGQGMRFRYITTDGHEITAGDPIKLAGVMNTQMNAVDGIYNYRGADRPGVLMAGDFNPIPADKEALYSNINRGLGGHKTRSFYNNIVTGGESRLSVTIDTHMLDAMILGVPATRSGVFAVGKTKFLSRGQNAAEGREGTYAVFQEGVRQAIEKLADDWTMAKAQAVSWLTTLSGSESSRMVNDALNTPDPVAVVAHVTGSNEYDADAQDIVEAFRTTGGYKQANAELTKKDISHRYTAQSYKEMREALQSPWDQFKAVKGDDTTLRLVRKNYAAAAYVAMNTKDNKKAKRDIDAIFYKEKLAKGKKQPEISEADVENLRQIAQRMMTLDKILDPSNEYLRDRITKDYNDYRHSLGIDAQYDLTRQELDDVLRQAADISAGRPVSVLPPTPTSPVPPAPAPEAPPAPPVEGVPEGGTPVVAPAV